MIKKLMLLLLLVVSGLQASAQCSSNNTAVTRGESLIDAMYYNGNFCI